MHLLGVKYTRGAMKFWDDLNDGKIKYESLAPVHGNLELFKAKLDGLKEIDYLISEGVRVTKKYNSFNLTSDQLLREQSKEIAIATKAFTGNQQIMISLINNSILNNLPKFPIGIKVTRILSIDKRNTSVKVHFDITK